MKTRSAAPGARGLGSKFRRRWHWSQPRCYHIWKLQCSNPYGLGGVRGHYGVRTDKPITISPLFSSKKLRDNKWNLWSVDRSNKTYISWNLEYSDSPSVSVLRWLHTCPPQYAHGEHIALTLNTQYAHHRNTLTCEHIAYAICSRVSILRWWAYCGSTHHVITLPSFHGICWCNSTYKK